jgi:hypothetical protein
MDLRVQMIDKVLEGGIEHFGGEYAGARQHHQRPPERPGPQNQQRDDYKNERANLDPGALLVAYGVPDSRQRETQAPVERLIFLISFRTGTAA